MVTRLSALCALVVAAAVPVSEAQTLTKCTLGQPVVDHEGKSGVIVSSAGNLCQVKYPNGQAYGWIYWNLRPDTASARPTAPSAPVGTKLPEPTTEPPPANAVQLPTVLRATPSNHTLVYRVGPLGHVVLTASVNGAPIRFLVDTGASTVVLSNADARTAGINPDALVYNKTTTTANGVVRVAPVVLHEIRIQQLSVENVPAVVDPNLNGSLLGMSFLSRLKSFQMREGELTFSW
ncbi:MAG: TIGR02281 family clan AA aspartic protease [Alphaproteobacteria bacterium]|nr:TIGR02281 family clan AA aspartic protease [Alphaproteobacteria bacterium]